MKEIRGIAHLASILCSISHQSVAVNSLEAYGIVHTQQNTHLHK